MDYKEYLKQLNHIKLLGWEVTEAIWLKNLTVTPSSLSVIISKSFEAKLPFFEAVVDTLSQRGLVPDSIIMLCNTINDKENKWVLTDDIIATVAKAGISYKSGETLHIKSQLKILKHIKDINLKEETTLKVFKNLLAAENDTRSQKIIYDFWVKNKQDPQKIKDLIPLVYTTDPSIMLSRKEFSIFTININKLSDEYHCKIDHMHESVNNIVRKYTTNFVDDIEVFDSSSSKMKVLFSDEIKAQRFNLFLYHCLDKISEKCAWATVLEKNKIIEEIDIKKISFAHNLDNILEIKKENTAKRKI